MSPDAELFNIRAAIEGCVACWTYITESQMYVGNTGDAAAIIVQNLSKLTHHLLCFHFNLNF